MKVAVLLLLGLSVCSQALLHTLRRLGSPSRRVSSTSRSLALYVKSKMPSFSEEEQAELERILAGEQMDFSRNVKKIPKAPTAAQETQAAPPAQAQAVVKPVMAPNSNWRTALTNPPAAPVQVQRNSGPGASAKPRKAPVAADDFSFMDLDYDDFEQAMREEDNGGMNLMSGVVSKHSDAPAEHNGLKSGARIKPEVWGMLMDNEGGAAVFSRVHRNMSDVVVFYADPRRMTAEFKLMLSQLDMLPKTSLKVATLAVNCDDTQDQRKFLKKNPINSVLLSDPGRKLMDSAKCRVDKRLCSALGLLDVSTGAVLKIWYEGDWDPVTTKDMIVEEVTAYRANPTQFMQVQIGIR
ncbi:hypothetical protein B484DRAFT_446815 [Ochromonadaceae sp. CCMP2298]|nr:hypothetical protein B484DRAFT_446815 [Ochromonadaceae sp. CCMP2298]|mmetsp:Transcript_28062/g.62152  ORF Transcript_28062/g.62152 Transcript_28062/m.62152 type:complete len:352 (-) Transcript_28062:2622-3677(-)